MSSTNVKSSAVDVGRFSARRLVPKHPVLLTAKAAGRATRVGTNGAASVSRAAVRTVEWSRSQLLASAKLLNPLVWTGRLTNRRPAGAPQRKILKQTPPPAAKQVAKQVAKVVRKGKNERGRLDGQAAGI